MSDDVEILGVGMIPFGKFKETTVEDLARRAAMASIRDAEIEPSAVQEVFCGSMFSGSLIGQRIVAGIGIKQVPVTNVENACSSGGTALREAVAAIRSGRIDTALVIGVDKLTRLNGGTIPLESTDLESSIGMALPAQYAMRAQKYMEATGATLEDLAGVAVKAHRNGSRNPRAQYRNIVSVPEVLASRPVATPLTLLMCCPTGDGAAALVVRRHRPKVAGAITIDASVLQSGKRLSGYRDMSRSELVARTAAIAYEEAGLGPEDLSLAEIHDAFVVAELMYYEALGLCPPGDGAALLNSGATQVDGRIPVNPSGGLLSRGHPIGATGVAQVCESVWQLRGLAGPNQVTGARTALTQVTGGGISGFDHGACSIHIISRHS